MANLRKYKKDAYVQALAFRRRGFTYSEIAKICNVSIGTVSNWLKNEPFSKVIAKDNAQKATVANTKRLALINKARITERKSQYAEITRLAEIEYKNYRTSPLFIAGVMLYLSDGDQEHKRPIRFTSSRPGSHKIFIRFLINYLGVPKPNIRFWLLLYPKMDEVTCLRHWTKKTGLSVAQCYKSQIVKSPTTKAPLHFGVGNTIIGSTLLKKKLAKWVELAVKEFTSK